MPQLPLPCCLALATLLSLRLWPWHRLCRLRPRRELPGTEHVQTPAETQGALAAQLLPLGLQGTNRTRRGARGTRESPVSPPSLSGSPDLHQLSSERLSEDRKRKRLQTNTGWEKNHSALELFLPGRISGEPGVKRQITDESDYAGKRCLHKMTCYGSWFEGTDAVVCFLKETHSCFTNFWSRTDRARTVLSDAWARGITNIHTERITCIG